MKNKVISRQLAVVAIEYVATVIILCGSFLGCDRDGGIDSTKGELRLRSPSFQDGEVIPKRHTGDGADVSPEFSWEGVPGGTVELVLIMDDPDAPRPEPWVHWVVYGIGAEYRSFREAVVISDSETRSVDVSVAGASLREGLNSWNTVGYRGPKPPIGHGVHHYRFTLYALDVSLAMEDGGITKTRLLEAMAGHVLAESQLIGTYER